MYEYHKELVLHIVLIDDNRFVSSSIDSIVLWNYVSYTMLRTFTGNKDITNLIHYEPENEMLVVCSIDGKILGLDINGEEDGRPVHEIKTSSIDHSIVIGKQKLNIKIQKVKESTKSLTMSKDGEVISQLKMSDATPLVVEEVNSTPKIQQAVLSPPEAEVFRAETANLADKKVEQSHPEESDSPERKSGSEEAKLKSSNSTVKKDGSKSIKKGESSKQVEKPKSKKSNRSKKSKHKTVSKYETEEEEEDEDEGEYEEEEEEEEDESEQTSVHKEGGEGEDDAVKNEENKEVKEDESDVANEEPILAGRSTKNINNENQTSAPPQSKGIIKNIDLVKSSKKQIKINGLFEINKELLYDPQSEELMSEGYCYIVAIINSAQSNSIFLYDLISRTKVSEIKTEHDSQITGFIRTKCGRLVTGDKSGDLHVFRPVL